MTVNHPLAPESEIATHYSHGRMKSDLLAALNAAGKDIDALTPDDLAPIDEIHIGGRQTTDSLFEKMKLEKGMRVLDIGCGVGGPGRLAASTFGCQVTGIDITPEFLEVAAELTRRTQLEDLATFQFGDAMNMSFESGSFNAAYMVSVAMHIPDKLTLFKEIRRVLTPGARFGISDVMRGEGKISYPLPWAASDETNFLATPDTYRELLTTAGFIIEAETDLTQASIAYFQQLRSDLRAAGKAPRLGLHLILGDQATVKTFNVVRGLQTGAIRQHEIIALA